VGDLLRDIFAAKAIRLADEMRAQPYEVVRERALRRTGERRSLLSAIRSADGVAVIAEIKRASPSAGLIAQGVDPARIAALYDAAGAAAISVLTEQDFFLGELAYLDLARTHAHCPILRKDFIATPYQVAQSAAFGADAVLLIMAALDDDQVAACMEEARRYALDVLVEVHDETELGRALALKAPLIGINNRNLRTFVTDLGVCERLIPLVPAEVPVIGESGIRAPSDVARLAAAGARGVLVGEAIMHSDDPAAFLRAIRSVVIPARYP
jgi:indole-3-glycerol phosphate synthase